MISGIQRSALAFGAVTAAMALGLGSIAVGTTGCERCMALCIGQLTFEGDIDVKAADKDELQIITSVENKSVNDNLLYTASGAIQCSELEQCTLTDNGDGTSHLKVVMEVYEEDGMKDGSDGYIQVRKVADGSEVLMQQFKVQGVTDRELCGQTCSSASVTW